jgi:hypothetical protein
MIGINAVLFLLAVATRCDPTKTTIAVIGRRRWPHRMTRTMTPN